MKLAAAVGGFLLAQPVTIALHRLLDDPFYVLVATVVIVAVGVLKGGLLRWAALGYGIGYVGFEALIVWALDKLDTGAVSGITPRSH